MIKSKTLIPLPITDLYNKFNSLTDNRDGKIYRTIQIGSKNWMADNLNFNITSSWCYENNNSNCLKYGRLYNWETAKKVCPSNWHLPNKEEFETLVQNIKERHLDVYQALIINGSSGFSALFGGYCYDNQSFDGIEEDTHFWSSTFNNGVNGGALNLRIYKNTEATIFTSSDEKCGFSVRCVKD